MGLYTASMKRVREIAKRREGQSMWTKERPKEPGWYWRRGKAERDGARIITEIVHIILSPAGFPNMRQAGSDQYSPRYYDKENEWLGPLRPDE